MAISKYGDVYRRRIEEIQYPSIESVNVTELITFFDVYESSVVNSSLFKNIKILQTRLNHKNFQYIIKVANKKPTKAVIKVFLGPKTDVYNNPIQLPRDYDYFYEIDNWLVSCKFRTILES